MITKLTAIICGYDHYTDYIDDGRQWRQAEQRNEERVREFISIMKNEFGLEVTNFDFFSIARCNSKPEEIRANIEAFLAAKTATTNNKEENIMANKNNKKDYTLGGMIKAATWQEFRVEMKKVGIDTATKTYAQLVEEYNALKTKAVITPAGDMSEDKYYPEEQTEKSDMLKNFNGIDDTHKKALIDAIVKKSFICTKEESDSKGMRIITMRKLFGIIKGVYGTGDNLPKDFIYNIINILVYNKYLCFKKYEEGGMVFYPTKKCVQ